MLVQITYNRADSVSYANEWAYRRNPNFLDFHTIGGDCTNFVSQCIYAGGKVMNRTPLYGWYYLSAEDRSPSWTGVPYLYRFLTGNLGVGPFAEEAPVEKIMPADIIQLGHDNNDYHHSLLVTGAGEIPSIENILVSTHSFDANRRPLHTYRFQSIRFLHIVGVRIEK